MRRLRVWLGLAVSLVFLYVAFRGQDLGQIRDALGRANYWYLLPGLGLYFLGVAVRSVRWSSLLGAVRRLAARELFPIIVIGYMANNILPLRAGEFVRVYALSNRTTVPKTAALATIAVERILDGLTMLIFMLVASLSIALTAQLQHLGLVASAIFGALLTGLVLITTERSRRVILRRVLPRLPNRLGIPAGHLIHSFLQGLGILRRRQDMLIAALTSLSAWLLEASMYALIAHGFGLGISPAAILLVTAVANLATLIPASPGYVGPFEAGILLVLVGALGLDRGIALSYAIVVHAALYLPITVLGLVYWWRESLSWSEVRTLSAKEGGD